MTIWTPKRHTSQMWNYCVVCPIKLLIVCLVLFECTSYLDHHVAVQAFKLSTCIVEDGNSSSPEVLCATIFRRQTNATIGEWLVAEFTFAVVDVLGEALRCQDDVNATDVQANETHQCASTNKGDHGSASHNQTNILSEGLPEIRNCSVMCHGVTDIFPNGFLNGTSAVVGHCIFFCDNVTQFYPNGFGSRNSTGAADCTIFCGSMTSLLRDNLLSQNTNLTANCQVFCKNVASLFRSEIRSRSAGGAGIADNCSISCRNVTKYFSDEINRGSTGVAGNCTVSCGNVNNVFQHQQEFHSRNAAVADNCGNNSTDNHNTLCSNSTYFFCNKFCNCSAVEAENCVIFLENETTFFQVFRDCNAGIATNFTSFSGNVTDSFQSKLCMRSGIANVNDTMFLCNVTKIFQDEYLSNHKDTLAGNCTAFCVYVTDFVPNEVHSYRDTIGSSAISGESAPTGIYNHDKGSENKTNKTCECKHIFGLRLVSVKLGPVNDQNNIVDEIPTTPKLAEFLNQLELMDVSFATNCSKDSPYMCSAPGTMELSSQCNLTTWKPGCKVTVNVNASYVPHSAAPPAKSCWTNVIAGLRLHGNVDSLQISGKEHTAIRVQEVLQALYLTGARAISLSYVDISDCSFPGVNLSGLRKLSISHSKLPANNCSFMDISAGDLEYLVLNNVSLSSVPRYLGNFTKLKILDLSTNPLMVSNDKESFGRELIKWSRLRNLDFLSLSNVQLGSLSVLRNLIYEPDGESCTPVSKLSMLLLSDCQIQDLEDEKFYNCLSRLKSLDLSKNVITKLSPRSFYPLKNLKELFLSQNYIETIPTMELNNETTLDFFDLSHNRIRSLSNFMRSGNTKLLDLSYNNIVEWPNEEMFCKEGTFLTWVQHLNISYNSLKTITRTMGDSLLILESVDLRGNKFDCSDCNTTEFQRWLMKTMFKFQRILDVSSMSNDVVCATPKALAGKKIMNITVDSSHCSDSETKNYVMIVVVPLITFIFALVLVGSALAYKYRFELAYVRYYWSIKKRRHAAKISENGEYEFDAFVSYSRQDRTWVLDELMEHLETSQDKYKLCLHERDFRLGSLILENIESSMRKSRYTLVILSRGFVHSQWCRWELEMANYKLFDDRREFLILLELEPLDKRDIPRHLKYLIETRTYLEWPGPGQPAEQETFWRRLRRALGESLHHRRHRPSAVTVTTTITTTTTTVITAATITTVVTTVANNKKSDHISGLDVTKNTNNAIISSTISPIKHLPYSMAVLPVPHSKLIEESDA